MGYPYANVDMEFNNTTHTDVNYSVIFMENVTASSLDNQTSALLDIINSYPDVNTYRAIRHVCYRIIMPCILGFGIVGNFLNIAILCQQRFQRSMDKMEQCANMGFIFLAASDLAFCLVGMPSAFLTSRQYADTGRTLEVVELYYTLYRPGIMNIFLLSSTWCVVLIAIERYLVVTHPMKARSSVRLRRTVILQIVIPLVSVIVNIPQFLRYNTQRHTTLDNTTLILPSLSKLAYNVPFRNIYCIIWNILGTAIPMVVLFYCNTRLLRAIYKTKAMSISNHDRYSTSRVTRILVAIICLFFALVCPSAILNFMQEIYISEACRGSCYGYLIATVIANVVQAANFAVNFILYFGMNPKFRAHARLRCTNGSCSTGKQIKKRIKQYELVNAEANKLYN